MKLPEKLGLTVPFDDEAEENSLDQFSDAEKDTMEESDNMMVLQLSRNLVRQL
jgi:hypothetical protein